MVKWNPLQRNCTHLVQAANLHLMYYMFHMCLYRNRLPHPVQHAKPSIDLSERFANGLGSRRDALSVCMQAVIASTDILQCLLSSLAAQPAGGPALLDGPFMTDIRKRNLCVSNYGRPSYSAKLIQLSEYTRSLYTVLTGDSKWIPQSTTCIGSSFDSCKFLQSIDQFSQNGGAPPTSLVRSAPTY
ncbi:hypothetical protein K439DRAFT_1015820 [Ramaria rubella]|nr:hypothetical protein K439DRAFT_1015820 [Ramaria rubella]